MFKKSMPKKKKPCPYCLKMRWFLLYFGCIAMVALLVANKFFGTGQ